MMPILNIGPLAIQLPGLLLIVGTYLGLWLAERYSPRYRIQPNTLYNIVFIALIFGILGARLFYILRSPEVFTGNLTSIVSLNYTMLDPLGGIITAALSSLIYGQRKNLPLWSTLDALTPILAVFAIALATAHFSSGSAFGKLTDLPWGIELWGAKRHPSQIYEVITASLVLILIFPSWKYISRLNSGTYFLLFSVLTSTNYLFLEAFRGDSFLLPGGFRLTQVIALATLIASIFLIKMKIAQEENHISSALEDTTIK
jgi:phosphatidylglycerol---prolipoprotein diacylglyceryl transferase